MLATRILINGRITTLDPRLPSATAVAVRDGVILAVGDDDSMMAFAGADTEVVNLGGRRVTPGLIDAHVHFRSYAMGLQQVDLDGAASLDEVLNRIGTRIDELGSSREGWLLGRGWSQGQWVDPAFPTAAHLDQVAPDGPALMIHKSGHAAWANGRALRVAGIDGRTPDPPGGQIQRDETGKPTGVFFEEAINLVRKHVPRLTDDQLVEAMWKAQEVCWRAGLTGIHDFDGPDCFRALQILRRNERLGLRVIKNIPVAQLDSAISLGLRSGFGDDWLRIGGIKIFADGALGPRTAAMISSYEGEPENYGIVVTDKEEILERASQASLQGLSVTIHAIGDRANHDVLDVFEVVRQEEAERGRLSPSAQLRHRIEHVQVLHPDDLERLGQLNVIASMQPIHATSDMQIADTHWGERSRYAYAWRTMLNAGTTLAFGSDAPVEPIEPLLGIHAAVTRRRADGRPGPDGWYPEQKLSLPETIHAFTVGAAIAGGQEARLGSITPGKLADLTVFEQDIFQLSPDELLDATIAGTVVAGEFRYRSW